MQPIGNRDDMSAGAEAVNPGVRYAYARKAANDILPCLAIRDVSLVRGGPTNGHELDFIDAFAHAAKAKLVAAIRHQAAGFVQTLLICERTINDCAIRREVFGEPSAEGQLDDHDANHKQYQVDAGQNEKGSDSIWRHLAQTLLTASDSFSPVPHIRMRQPNQASHRLEVGRAQQLGIARHVGRDEAG